MDTSKTGHDGSQPGLKRTLGLFALTLYGVGDILGAGIYALVGEVSAAAGVWSWAAFLVAMTVAGLTAFAYCELVTRFPHSGGESTFALRAFRKSWLAFLTGWMVFCAGVFSMSGVTHACAGYVQELFPGTPGWPLWLLFLATIAGLNFRGIRESSIANIVFTLIEASGLLLIILIGVAVYLRGEGGATPIADVSFDELPGAAPGILSGAAIAFFAYIGFEDMINVAEEVEEPQRDFAKAILLAVTICGVVYIAVALAALSVLSPDELAATKAPLLAVVQRGAPWVPEWFYTAIALIAVFNTGLLNSITSSRLLYGMSTHRLLPRWLDRIHGTTHTPHRAILAIFVIGVVLVSSGTLSRLTATTSFLLLLAFCVVNLSLIRLRLRADGVERSAAVDSDSKLSPTFRVPLPVPAIATVLCLGLLVFLELSALLTGLGVIAVGAILAIVAARRGVQWEELHETADSSEP